MEKENRFIRILIVHRYAALCLFCCLLYLSNLGGYRLFDVDEPRYAETARYMTESGDYVLPVFNGAYRFEKPVLSYWLIAASYRLFGVNEWGARFPSAVTALGTVLLCCLLAGRLWSAPTGLAAGVILACCLQFIALGRWAITDMHLTMFISAGLVLFYLGAAAEDKKKGRLYYLGAFACSALAVLTKGPVGFVLPASVAFVYILVSGRVRESLARVPFVSGIFVLCMVALPWYVLVTLRSDFEFFRVFIIQHNIQRFFGDVAPGGQHIEPFYYYLPCLLLGIYPWSFFALQAIIRPLRRLVRQWKSERALTGKTTFPLLWCVLVLLFFSLSRAKLPTYITPAFPPLAILIAGYLYELASAPSGRRTGASLFVPVLLGALTAAALAVFLIIGAGKIAPFELGNLHLFTALAVTCGPLGAVVLVIRRRHRGAFIFQSAGQTLFALLIALSILPVVSNHRQEPQKRLTEQACAWLGDSGTLAAYRYRKTALSFYSRRVVLYLEADHKAETIVHLPGPLAVITRERHSHELVQKCPFLDILAVDEGLVLLAARE